jgi:hypothetical protein
MPLRIASVLLESHTSMQPKLLSQFGIFASCRQFAVSSLFRSAMSSNGKRISQESEECVIWRLKSKRSYSQFWLSNISATSQAGHAPCMSNTLLVNPQTTRQPQFDMERTAISHYYSVGTFCRDPQPKSGSSWLLRNNHLLVLNPKPRSNCETSKQLSKRKT